MTKIEGKDLKSEPVTYDPKTMPTVACIMHPAVESVTQVTSPIGPIYGLCSKCTAKLRAKPAYQQTIDEEINKHLTAMKGNK